MCLILSVNKNQTGNSHIYNELSFSECVSPKYLIVTDIFPAYFTHTNSSHAKISDLTIFHSGWGSSGGNSTYWTLNNNTCFSLLGHANLEINYDHLSLISNSNEYLILFYGENENYFISNSVIIGNKMEKFHEGTLTLDSCIYDTNDDLVVNPNCISTNNFTTYIQDTCVIFYQNVCSNLEFYTTFNFPFNILFIVLVLI